ncbi:PREDICTED: uncharacterized protein LOC108779943 [Cyphomyrmex costatus]|uniref:uncharacterized protein LOC108779943 n=1 Tax=Cyphomyrmex costatus TaxID=456900 RepID=UPI0008523AD0|nr:PREDICTED: uncharacterized protein LOC108779943 [Cyphomyrmex costatus]
MSSRNYPRCAACSKYLHKTSGTKKVIINEEEASIFSNYLQKTIVVQDILCSKCRLFQNKKKKLDEDVDSTFSVEYGDHSESSSNDPTFSMNLKTVENKANYEKIEVQLPRTVSTHKYCCLCNSQTNLTVVPKEACLQAFIKKQIHIPEGNKCCQKHLIKNRFYEDDVNLLKKYSNTSYLSSSEWVEMMGNLAIRCDSTLYDKIADYTLPENQLLVFTGLHWENIIQLRDMLTSMRNRQTRTVTQALVVFLFKLRTGNSNKLLASILQIEYEQLVSEYVSSIITAFEEDVLPSRFGLASVTKDDLINNHTTQMAKILFEVSDKLFVICDGTYARHQKSANNEFQRKSFSGQKKVPLCKPFTICTTDGFIVDMLGPYPANLNDAEILKMLLKDPEGLCKLLEEGDYAVLDRGFRDVKNDLEDKNIKVLMPALKGKRKQLTTKESNESRFVTKLRWVVEAVHGILKQKYKLLDHKLDNKILPKVRALFRITSFLNNLFGKRLESDQEFSEEILERIRFRENVENPLAVEAEKNGWFRKKVIFQSISSSDIQDFPELTEKDLKIFFTGSYQLSQAISYLAEMTNQDGEITMQYVKDQSNVLKVQVQSRHISRKVYKCFIKYKPNTNGIAGILEYVCDCANGNRTVGCCSHIAAIVYYLSHARYLSKILKPAHILSEMFDKTKIIPVIEEDSDED